VVSTGSTDGPRPTDGPESTDGPQPTDAPGESGGAGQAGMTEQARRPGRYETSPAGMVGALIVTLLVILAFVAFRAFNRTDLDVKPAKIDYLSQVRIAQQAAPKGSTDLVYPARLPSGWYATNVTLSVDGTRPDFRMSMLTADEEYVGFIQSPTALAELLTTYVDPQPQAGPPVTVPGAITPRWDTWTDSGGDTALTARHDGESLMVFGTVSRAQLEQLAASLTTAPVSG
jgi:hypothetical protein